MTQVVVEQRSDAPPHSAGRSPSPVAVVLGAAAVFYAVFIWRTSWVVDGRRRFTLFDDAMISMSYARTFADGHGLVWFPDAPAVEGFTNPLWVAVMAALHASGLPASGVALTVMLLSAVLCLSSALLAVAIVRRLTVTSPGLDAAVAGAVAFSYPLVYWSLRGMEVGLITALTLTGTWLVLRLDEDAEARSWRLVAALAAVLVAGVATRLDFAVVAGALLLWRCWRSPRGRRTQAVAVPTAAVALALVAQELLRHAYYGRWVPNTFTLKTSGVPLADRILRGGWVTCAVVIGSLAASASLLVLARRRRALARPTGVGLLVLVGSTLLAYSWWAGGDAWEWMAHPNRYLSPAVLLLMIAAAAGTADLLRATPVPRPASIRRAVVLAGVLSFIGPWVAFGILSVGGLDPIARTDLGGAAVLALLALVGIVATIAGRRLWEWSADEAPLRAAAVTIVVMTVGAGLLPILQWVGDGGAYQSVDRRATELGLVLGQVTEPGAAVAVVGAGAPIYYSGRAGIDLLGKSDAHVASVASRGAFTPGHTKWDYAYSVGELRPDVITQLFHPTRGDLDLLARSGYELREVQQDLLPSRLLVFVRSDSTRVDRTRLEPASPELVAAYEAEVLDR